MAAVTTKCTQCAAELRLRDEGFIGREIRCPRCKSRFVAVSGESPDSSAPAPRIPPAECPIGVESVVPVIPPIRTESGRRPGARSGRRRRRWSPIPFVLLCLVVTAAGAATAWWFADSGRPTEKETATTDNVNSAPMQHAIDGSAAVSAIAVAQSPGSAATISMEYLPVVPQLILHLRPAEIWTDDADRRELTAALGDFGVWLLQFIRKTTRFEPSEIDELTIAVNFGARTSVPDFAAVIRLKEEHRESQLLLKRIGGTLIRDMATEVYESDELAFIVIDSKTLAVSSLDLAEDLADAKRYAAVPQPEMESLLHASSRRRHMTLIADLQVSDLHKDLVLMEQLHELAEDTVLWFGTDCRMLSWSAHLDPHLSMETRLTHTAESTAKRLHARMQRQLEQLPARLLAAVRTMRPATLGHRRIIGRFPAMIQAIVLGTQVNRSATGATLTTILPGKAAANLTAGATLTWNQSVVSAGGHAESVPAAPATGSGSIAERLLQPVLIDFRREPLQEALAYIANEIQATVVIDGDALKLAGFTKNMQQTHDLGEVTALAGIDTILRQYEGKMVIVVDEVRSTILLTTRTAADAQGLTTLDTTAAD